MSTLKRAEPNAVCEDCLWQGRRRDLIWVKAWPKCYWRCPECHSAQLLIAGYRDQAGNIIVLEQQP